MEGFYEVKGCTICEDIRKQIKVWIIDGRLLYCTVNVRNMKSYGL